MKKEYLIPQMEVVKIETAQMLAASARELGDGTEEGFLFDDDGLLEDSEPLR